LFALGKIKEGVGNVVEFGKKIIDTPGIKDASNIGTAAFGIPFPVGDIIFTGIDFASNFL
jgi:hypothetical protein